MQISPQMLRNPVGSGSASGRGRAATAPCAVELGAGRDWSLARGALGIAQLDVVSPASAGRFLFRVASAAIPNTFAEGHALSLAMKRVTAQRGCASLSAMDMPLRRHAFNATLAPVVVTI